MAIAARWFADYDYRIFEIQSEKKGQEAMKRKRKQDGSVTIEATIGLTAFVFLIVTILSFINICRAQMVVSLAVDATAKEMSQYSYFYGLSGLQSLADVLHDTSSESKNTTNELIGYTKTMCTSLTNIGGDVQAGVNQVQQGMTEQENAQTLNDAINAAQQTAQNLQQTGQSMQDNAGQIKEAASSFGNCIESMDAESYMRGLGALAANEAYHAVLSKVICPPLAKAMCVKHIEGYGDGDADAALKSMGISEGMDGLNFMMSEMFSEDEPTQIHLVCYYTVSPCTLVELPGDTRMVFCKESVTNAWLNGYYKKCSDEEVAAGDAQTGEDPETPTEEEKTEEEPEEEGVPERLRTAIEEDIQDIEDEPLPDDLAKAFVDGEYRTVVTTDCVLLYRVFGGEEDMVGPVFCTREFASEEEARQAMAELPEYGNSCQYTGVVLVPAGTVLRVGKTASQRASDGTVYAGGEDRVIIEGNWMEEHPDWLFEQKVLGNRED